MPRVYWELRWPSPATGCWHRYWVVIASLRTWLTHTVRVITNRAEWMSCHPTTSLNCNKVPLQPTSDCRPKLVLAFLMKRLALSPRVAMGAGSCRFLITSWFPPFISSVAFRSIFRIIAVPWTRCVRHSASFFTVLWSVFKLENWKKSPCYSFNHSYQWYICPCFVIQFKKSKYIIPILVFERIRNHNNFEVLRSFTVYASRELVSVKADRYIIRKTI